MSNILLKIFFLVYMLFLFSCSPKSELQAKERIFIYQTINAAIQENPNKLIKEMKKDEILKIIRCHDIKSSFILEVRINNNQRGFIGYGEYKLLGHPQCY